eukprot:16897_1
MGVGQRKKKGNKGGHNTKNKEYKKKHATRRRAMDVDQVQDMLAADKKVEFELDNDLPGLGQYYCPPCARHFINADSLSKHSRSKVHKRRLKDVAQKQYTQDEADLGAGKTKQINGPSHPHQSDRAEDKCVDATTIEQQQLDYDDL